MKNGDLLYVWKGCPCYKEFSDPQPATFLMSGQVVVLLDSRMHRILTHTGAYYIDNVQWNLTEHWE